MSDAVEIVNGTEIWYGGYRVGTMSVNIPATLYDRAVEAMTREEPDFDGYVTIEEHEALSRECDAVEGERDDAQAECDQLRARVCELETEIL